ncbi:hypothetical protein H0A36_19285 [Endozoicomonas sp. SM1973]|uniref:Uncharacterized protein n=1 Tax=Spartinivicinus marinus TaxID=2994442 RepID=A0A853IG96_9GAMM|nr:hypothetical protein [Spartinivicinus marinus]MCX4029326.1 hypothetical protein [Spartinivicinus marinus]NYZ68165.1 hypothetical protein [Spartinivicinus marinus]
MSDDKVIDFVSAKEPHLHARKEQKVKNLQQRFEACLPMKKKTVAKKKVKKRKKK